MSLLIDQGALNVLHQSLPQLMISSPKKLADQFLEMIALMGKRWVQEEWPTLIPVIYPRLSSLTLGAHIISVVA